MDINARDLTGFAQQLCRVYDTLSGIASIEEPYGMHMYLNFQGDGRGHIAVQGFLFGGNGTGNEHSLKFKNSIDQTELRPFCFALEASCAQYLKR